MRSRMAPAPERDRLPQWDVHLNLVLDGRVSLGGLLRHLGRRG